ncbi:hypothetical protein BZM27_32970, partial [Paraburkholderia steynii]
MVRQDAIKACGHLPQCNADSESSENVKLSGFGNFQLQDKSQRPARNPKTGETAT